MPRSESPQSSQNRKRKPLSAPENTDQPPSKRVHTDSRSSTQGVSIAQGNNINASASSSTFGRESPAQVNDGADADTDAEISTQVVSCYPGDAYAHIFTEEAREEMERAAAMPLFDEEEVEEEEEEVEEGEDYGDVQKEESRNEHDTSRRPDDDYEIEQSADPPERHNMNKGTKSKRHGNGDNREP